MNKLLALLQILIKQTDENHKLTTNQLIEKLSEQGVYAHRNTIPSDIEKLRNEGYDIICDKSTKNKYFMSYRTFAFFCSAIHTGCCKSARHEASSDAYRRTKNNAQNFRWNYPQKIFQEFKKEYRIGNF